MSLLDEVCGLLEGVPALGLKFGVNLFATYLPDDPDEAVVVYSYGGMAPQDTLGLATSDPVTGEARPGEPAWVIPRFQVLVRSAGAQTAQARALDVYRTLHAVRNREVGGTWYLRVRAVQEPFLLQRDERKRVAQACNYEAMKRFS